MIFLYLIYNQHTFNIFIESKLEIVKQSTEYYFVSKRVVGIYTLIKGNTFK